MVYSAWQAANLVLGGLTNGRVVLLLTYAWCLPAYLQDWD